MKQKLLTLLMAFIPLAMMAYDVEVNGIYFNVVKKTQVASNISFADDNVKALCVAYWDIDGDGELSESEAADVTDLGSVFSGNTVITSFNELQYFTGLTSIGADAFRYCSGLTSVTIPSSVTSIGDYAFQYTGLTSLIIPSSVTSIGTYSIADCTSLTSVSIPSSLQIISHGAFGGCSNLTSVTFPEGVTGIGENAFGHCFGLTSVIFPSSVTSIGDYAFRYCSGLTSVTIPSSVTNIGSYAFENCESLTEVTCNATVVPSTSTNAFLGSNVENATLFVPEAALSDYQTTAPWSYFGTIQGSQGAESLSSNYIVAHFNTTGGNAAIGWSLSHDGILNPSTDSYETTIQHISKIVIDDNEYSYLGANLSDYGYDTSVEHIVKYYFDSPLTNINAIFGNIYNIDFLDMSHFDASQIQQMEICILGMVSLDTWVMPANLNVDNCVKNEVTSIDNTALTNVFCPSDRLSDYQAFFVNTDTRVYNCLKADDSYYEEPDDVDDEGFRYIKEFTYVRDISDYTGSGLYNWFVNATQHITETDILKANVFKVGQFYGRSEGQSYAHFKLYGDRNLDNCLGEFNFAWAWYKLCIGESDSGDNEFSFVDAYDNMAIGDTRQFTDAEGNSYTITVLGKGVEDGDEKLTFCCDRPLYFGGVDNGSVGIERFSNRVQIQYLRDISEIGGVEGPTTVTLTIGSAGVCTFASPYDLNFAGIEGVKAYIAGGFKPSTGRLVLLRADEVPAGTGLYIKGTPGTYTIPIQETDMLFVNFLVGITEDTEVSPTTDTHKNYVLANGSYGVGFYPLSKTGTISAGKAYLSIPTSSGNASANFIGLEFEDEETTSITSVECLMPNDGFWYTLDGRKLDKKPTQKGVYIMKGQKVVIK